MNLYCDLYGELHDDVRCEVQGCLSRWDSWYDKWDSVGEAHLSRSFDTSYGVIVWDNYLRRKYEARQ